MFDIDLKHRLCSSFFFYLFFFLILLSLDCFLSFFFFTVVFAFVWCLDEKKWVVGDNRECARAIVSRRDFSLHHSSAVFFI